MLKQLIIIGTVGLALAVALPQNLPQRIDQFLPNVEGRFDVLRVSNLFISQGRITKEMALLKILRPSKKFKQSTQKQ